MKCFECDAELRLPPDPMAGEIITCPDCGASFEIFSEGGVFNIRPAQIEGEDWGE